MEGRLAHFGIIRHSDEPSPAVPQGYLPPGPATVAGRCKGLCNTERRGRLLTSGQKPTDDRRGLRKV